MNSETSEIIRIMCPNLGCQRILAVPPRAQGRVVRCRGCGTNIRIPQPEAHASDSAGAGAAHKHAA
jgi:ribosomal protein S27E